MLLCLHNHFFYIVYLVAFKTTSGLTFVNSATRRQPVTAPLQLLVKLLPKLTTGIHTTAFCQTNGIQSDRTHPYQILVFCTFHTHTHTHTLRCWRGTLCTTLSIIQRNTPHLTCAQFTVIFPTHLRSHSARPFFISWTTAGWTIARR
jgi:hypothetical protein